MTLSETPAKPELESSSALLLALRGGERRALARALTFAESQHSQHRAQLDQLWQHSGPAPTTALRVAFTGPPGAGKSSLIEKLGTLLLEAGGSLAVLPIDPSSQLSGGSLLADQTRMPELSRHPQAFIRPSAAGNMLGGLAAHTHESIELCELAGYSWVILETVGVGQNEVDVAASADLVLLVLTADAGDELQALKRGINEVSHALIVNKAEGERKFAAEELGRQYAGTAELWGAEPLRVFVTSAHDGSGLSELGNWLGERRREWLSLDTEREQRRREQRMLQFERALHAAALPRLLGQSALRARYEALRSEISAGQLSVPGALARFFEELRLEP